MESSYPACHLPNSLYGKEFQSFTKKDLKQYFEWFLSIKQSRVKIFIEDMLRLFPSFPILNKFEKLDYIEQYINHTIKDNSNNKIVKFYLQQFDLNQKTVEYDFESQNRIFDISIFIGDFIISELDNTKWHLFGNKSKKDYYFAKIVLTTVDENIFKIYAPFDKMTFWTTHKILQDKYYKPLKQEISTVIENWNKEIELPNL